MNELQDKLMTVRLREAQAQAELREVKLKALQLESQVRHTIQLQLFCLGLTMGARISSRYLMTPSELCFSL